MGPWLLALLLQRPITLAVRPQVCLAPCTIRVSVRIARDPNNRTWAVLLESEGFSSTSVRELDGDRAPITQPDLEFRDLPAGEYLVTARLSRHTRSAPEYHTTSIEVSVI